MSDVEMEVESQEDRNPDHYNQTIQDSILTLTQTPDEQMTRLEKIEKSKDELKKYKNLDAKVASAEDYVNGNIPIQYILYCIL